MDSPLPRAARPSAAALEMIDRLIAFPTVSRDSNLGLIEFARDHLARLGAKPHLVYDLHEKKANLFATLADDPDAWSPAASSCRDTPTPCRSTARTGRAIRSRPITRRSHPRPRHRRHEGLHRHRAGLGARFWAAQERMPIHLSLTYDEETTFYGVRGLVKDLEERGVRPAGCMIGEPTDMQRDRRAQGQARLVLPGARTRGAFLADHHRRQRHRVRRAADRSHPQRGRSARARGAAGRALRRAAHHAADRVMKGGIAVNVVPRDCEFTVRDAQPADDVAGATCPTRSSTGRNANSRRACVRSRGNRHPLRARHAGARPSASSRKRRS